MAEKVWIGDAQAGLIVALIIRAIDKDEPFDDYWAAFGAVKMCWKFMRQAGIEESDFVGKVVSWYDGNGKLVDEIIGHGDLTKERVTYQHP